MFAVSKLIAVIRIKCISAALEMHGIEKSPVVTIETRSKYRDSGMSPADHDAPSVRNGFNEHNLYTRRAIAVYFPQQVRK